MTRGKHTSKSAERIWKSKPNSREAHAAARAAQRYAAGGSQAGGGKNDDGYSPSGGGGGGGGGGDGGGGGEECRNPNRYGAYCTIREPCDAHASNWMTGT